MLKYILKIIITPENIWNIILSILPIIALCLIFSYFHEKWYKALIPVYGDFIFYKITYNCSLLFLIEFIFDIINAFSMSKIKKHVLVNIIDIIKEKNIEAIDLDSTLIIVNLIIFIITLLILQLYKSITYCVLCTKLELNMFFIILTFLFPNIFLFIDIVYKKHQIKKQNSLG